MNVVIICFQKLLCISMLLYNFIYIFYLWTMIDYVFVGNKAKCQLHQINIYGNEEEKRRVMTITTIWTIWTRLKKFLFIRDCFRFSKNMFLIIWKLSCLKSILFKVALLSAAVASLAPLFSQLLIALKASQLLEVALQAMSKKLSADRCINM